MNKIPLKVVAGIFVCPKKHEVLLSLRPQGKPLEGYWEFPGGKVESGESLKSALIRECQEELGVLITPENALFLKQCDIKYPDFLINLTCFQILSWENEPSPQEGQGLSWHTLEDVKNLKTLPRMIEILELIL